MLEEGRGVERSSSRRGGRERAKRVSDELTVSCGGKDARDWCWPAGCLCPLRSLHRVYLFVTSRWHQRRAGAVSPRVGRSSLLAFCSSAWTRLEQHGQARRTRTLQGCSRSRAIPTYAVTGSQPPGSHRALCLGDLPTRDDGPYDERLMCIVQCR
jgi:hypothetical protein